MYKNDKGYYTPSRFELQMGCLLCPNTQEPMELVKLNEWIGFVRGSTKIDIKEIEGLPEGWIEICEHIGLPSNITTWISSLIGLPASVVEACRLLDLTEQKATSDKNLATQAARISSLKFEILKKYRKIF